MPGSSPQTPASTHKNAHVTVVAELNMLFRNKTQDMCCSETRHKIFVVQKQDTRCMLFRDKPQDVCCSETSHKMYVVQKQDTRYVLFRNKTQDICCSET